MREKCQTLLELEQLDSNRGRFGGRGLCGVQNQMVTHGRYFNWMILDEVPTAGSGRL